jgi:hypothetical protein
MRKYLTNSDFYLSIFPADPDYKTAEVLTFIIENNHAFVTIGLPYQLPKDAPKSWNKHSLNSTKLIISFQYTTEVSIKGVLQNEICQFTLSKNKEEVHAIFLASKGVLMLLCKFVSIGGVVPYDNYHEE